ncbi:helix-turn-helix transcriptional regulator [Aeromicrobium sp. 179-A 4D2 NHS]|uniref:helix-turn-helix transcriptional regulator n=1 Tax=Aeromicrobium sp. 179-A 4D2 NHS TaxID=3142375 RepID=UPI0039A0366A
MAEYLTVEDVAELVHVSPSTVRWWAHASRGPRSFSVGKRRLYARADVEAWIEAAKAAS